MASQYNSSVPRPGAGRSAPTLIDDITLHDPRRRAQDQHHLLQDPPVNFTYSNLLKEYIPPGSCRHELWLKPRQSVVPQLDERAGPNTVWTIATICRICRLHFRVKVDYTIDFLRKDQPCPNAERPLHHFVRAEWRDAIEVDSFVRERQGQSCEASVFECSATGCSAVVSILITAPELTDQVIETLTDKQLLRERTEAAFKQNESNTQGMRPPLPIDVLNDLRIYIKNAWEQDPARKSIKLSNRRFMVRFGPRGEACNDVLETIGFRLDEEADCWNVPEPDEDDIPFEKPLNVILDNVELELLALVISRPEDEHQQIQDLPRPQSAQRELERALGCQDFDKHVSSRSSTPDPVARAIPFVGLGLPESAADILVRHFYHYQVAGDPANTPRYLTFLKHIAMNRNSEMLQTESVLEESKGRYDVHMLDEAYRYFGLDPSDKTLDDEHILGIFSSRLMDMRSHEAEMRQYLRVIGQDRNSDKIMEMAENTMTTYDQALEHLEVAPDVTDEGIQAMYTVKVNENLEKTQKAVGMIADHRNSALLHSWINSGYVSDRPMDAAEGYQALQIDDRMAEDDLILSAYDVAIIDSPHNQEHFTRALTAIAKDRGSTMLRDRVQQNTPQSMQMALEEPVGLENIGNTCYLNSLLQFLFTIVELRRVVLNFENYKMDSEDESMSTKKVGQRKISKREVQTAQKFVDRLAGLFSGMIQAPQTVIRPEKELAKLTLETDNVKEKLRRRSTLAGERPNLGHLDSQTYPGPLTLPQTQPNGEANMPALQSPLEFEPEPEPKKGDKEIEDALTTTADEEVDMPDLININDNSSEATLVSRPGSVDTPAMEILSSVDQQAILDDKENLSPTKTEEMLKHGATEAEHPMPLAPASPSKINVQAGALAHKDEEIQPQPLPQPLYAPPPGKPPPVPPRKPIEPTTDILEEYARQQDVAEVLAHCLFQTSCAMRPTGVDKSGEQEDEVHDLFFGQTLSHTVPEKEAPAAVPFFSVITRVANQPRDVYEAIDTEYDLSVREGSSKAFVSMSRLPPVLSIALDRVTWDKAAGRAVKSNHHVEVPERIFLDRYLEAPQESDVFQRRQHTWELKQQLASLDDRRKVLETSYANADDVPSLFDEARLVLETLQSTFPDVPDDPFGGSLQIKPETISAVSKIAEETRAELAALKSSIAEIESSLSQSFTDVPFLQHPYRLHAAFFHRGVATGGHYWIYIYDHVKEIWRKYNDDRVSIVDNRNEIFGNPNAAGNNTWASPNPYFLVYVREDKVNEIVETVRRDVVWTAPEGPPPALPEGHHRIQPQQEQYQEYQQQPSQMSHMPPSAITSDQINGVFTPDTSPPSNNQTDSPITEPRDVEMKEFTEMKEAKPQAYKTARMPQGYEGYVPYSGRHTEEKRGEWDSREADDVGGSIQW